MTFSDASLPVPIVEYYMLNIYLTGKNAIIFIILPGQSRFFSIFFLRKSRLDFALCFSRNYRLFWFLQLCHNPALHCLIIINQRTILAQIGVWGWVLGVRQAYLYSTVNLQYIFSFLNFRAMVPGFIFASIFAGFFQYKTNGNKMHSWD